MDQGVGGMDQGVGVEWSVVRRKGEVQVAACCGVGRPVRAGMPSVRNRHCWLRNRQCWHSGRPE
eukprot:scaffold23597_cov76-Isochrysis_galbana.AAC.2